MFIAILRETARKRAPLGSRILILGNWAGLGFSDFGDGRTVGSNSNNTQSQLDRFAYGNKQHNRTLHLVRTLEQATSSRRMKARIDKSESVSCSSTRFGAGFK